LALKAPGLIERLPMAYRDGLIARLETPEWPGSLEVVNIHMMNPILWPPWKSVELRGRQLDALLAHIEQPGTRLIAGDFNASPVWPVYRRLTARLEDAAVSAARERGVKPFRTWGPTPASPRMLRIDHVFVERVRPIDIRRVEIPGSDHSGLLVDVELG
jgi:endonuclease/exonuclease/phosphatase (EEP) superfamily protein YafD